MEENLPELNSSSPRFSRKQILSVVVLVVLLISIPIGVYLVQHTQIFKPKAAEKKGNYLVNKERPKPEYAAGEIIFKLKPKTPKLEVKQEKMAAGLNLDKQAVSFDDLDENTIPQILKEIHQKYKIKQIEKVFKGTEEPEKELNKFKNRFAKEIQEGRRKINEKEFLKIDLSKVYKINIEQQSQTETVVQELSQKEGVEYAELNYVLKTSIIPNDPDFSKLWGLHNTGQTGGTADADIDAPEAWDTTTGDSNIVVGVIDTGIDYNHPDLKDNIWTNPQEATGAVGIDDDNNGYVDDIHGYDWVNNDSDPMDDNNHGTHVSGTIGAVANNSIGVAGVAWQVKLMALKFLNSGGSGYTDNAVKAIEYANKMGVKITSNSWGGSGYSQTLYDAIKQSGDLDALFVAAAGNSTYDIDVLPSYPASYNLANIISVASTDYNDELSSFSNWGLTSVDLSAPGDRIYSTLPKGSYGILSGTSMATPHVSGAVALVWSKFPSLSHLKIKNRILVGTDTIDSLNGKVLSGGRLNAVGSLSSTLSIYTPKKFYFKLLKGDSSKSSVLLINNGAVSTLHWTVESTVSWLTTSLSSGDIAEDGSQQIFVNVNTATMAAGFYNASLNFKTNDPNFSSFSIPVTLDVTGTGMEKLEGWETLLPLPEERFNASGSVSPEGFIFVAGGTILIGDKFTDKFTVYTAKLNSEGKIDTWFANTSLPKNIGDHTSFIYDNYLFVVGGASDGHPVADVYSAKINADGMLERWTATTSLPIPLIGHGGVIYKNHILILGGTSGGSGGISGKVYSAEINLDGKLGEWKETTPLTEPLYEFAAVNIDDNLYLMGGVSSFGSRSWVYSAKINDDGTLGGWLKLTSPLPEQLANFPGISLDNNLFVLGGSATAWPSNKVYSSMASPTSPVGAWIEDTGLPVLLLNTVAISYKDRIYVIGGQSLSMGEKGVYSAKLRVVVPSPTPTPTPTPSPSPSPSLVPTPTPVPGSKACLQVITPAKNPATGECKTYPTSCIPDGWVKVSSCTIQ